MSEHVPAQNHVDSITREEMAHNQRGNDGFPISNNDVRDPSSLSPFEQLPRELAWKIVGYAHENVHSLNLISRLLNVRVREFALEQDTLGLVRSMEIDRSDDQAKDVVKLRVANHQSNLFELRLKRRLLNERVKRRDFGKFREYRVELDCSLEADSDALMLGTLKECTGYRVNKAILNCYWRPETGGLPESYDYVKGMHFDSLRINEFNLCTHLIQALPLIIKEHKVDHFSLSVGEVSNASIVEILLEIASLVRSMSLHQISVYRRHHENYFMGLSDVDWAQVIIDMFSRKMDKLYIDNPSFPAYLSEDKVVRLIDTLPMMGKKLWFEATCSRFDATRPELSYTMNDYLVKAYVSGIAAVSLAVKHSSRELEKYEKEEYFPFSH